MASKNWKSVAIIFIILFCLENAFLFWVIKTANDDVEFENICMVNICGGVKYDAYFYDTTNNMCSCYNDNEVIYQQVLS